MDAHRASLSLFRLTDWLTDVMFAASGRQGRLASDEWPVAITCCCCCLLCFECFWRLAFRCCSYHPTVARSHSPIDIYTSARVHNDALIWSAAMLLLLMMMTRWLSSIAFRDGDQHSSLLRWEASPDHRPWQTITMNIRPALRSSPLLSNVDSGATVAIAKFD